MKLVVKSEALEKNIRNNGYKYWYLSCSGAEDRIMEYDNEKSFEEIRDSVTEYQNHTNLLFSLESLTNLARNGRVNPAVAKIAGVLGIRVFGAVTEGVLDPIQKIRGEAKTIEAMFAEMKKRGITMSRGMPTALPMH